MVAAPVVAANVVTMQIGAPTIKKSILIWIAGPASWYKIDPSSFGAAIDTAKYKDNE